MNTSARFVIAAVLALAGCPWDEEEVNRAARNAGVIAPVGSGTAPAPAPGTPESALQRVSDFLNNAITRCRNQPHFGPQLPPDAAAGETLGTGIACPADRVVDLPKPECEDHMDFKAAFSMPGLEGEAAYTATVKVTVTSNQSLQHNHQATTCDNPGECDPEYVYWLAVVDTELKVETTAQVAGKAITIPVTAAFGASKHNYSFKAKRPHQAGDRKCAKQTACVPDDSGTGTGGSSGTVGGGGAPCEVPARYACPDGSTGECCGAPNDCPTGCEVW